MSINFKMDGFKQLEKSLSKLPKALADGVERTALRQGAKPIEKKAKASVAVSSGLLKQSIGISVKKSRGGANKGNLSARVGARTGFTKIIGIKDSVPIKQNPVKYAHLVEYGTSRTAAKPFIRPAAESSHGEIMDGLAKGYEKGMARTVKKIRKL